MQVHPAFFAPSTQLDTPAGRVVRCCQLTASEAGARDRGNAMHLAERTTRLPGGESVFCRYWLPDARNKATDALLLLHGVESHSLWFEELAPLLAGQGIAVCAPDRPGWGASPGRKGDLQHYDKALSRIDHYASDLWRDHGKVHLAGLSWGGKLALYAALRRPGTFCSLTLIAPGLCPRNSVSLADKVRVAASTLFFGGRGRIGLPFRDEDFTRRPDKTAFIRSDPHRTHNVTARFCIESLKMDRFIAENIPRLRIPAQLLLAGDDRIMDNAATDRLFSLAGSESKRVKTHEGAAHSLVFETPQRTAGEIREWTDTPRAPSGGRWRISIMGAGAVGGFLGGLLAAAGHDVTLIGRESQAEAIRNGGLRLRLGGAERKIRQNLRCVTDPAEIGAHQDLAVLCVKSFDTEEAVKDLQPVLAAGTPVLCLQNGVRNEERIREFAPETPVIAGAICAYASMEGPGHVRVESDLGGIALGPSENSESNRRLAVTIQAALQRSGWEIAFHERGTEVKWSKLMLNVAFNAINALTGLGTAEIMRHPRLGPLAVETFGECAKVMRALGINPVALPNYNVALLARVMRLPQALSRRMVARFSQREARGKSSMAQDFSRARGRTEIEEINGAVASIGESHGIPTPANTHLLRMVEVAANDPAMLQAFHDTPSLAAEGYGED